MVETVHQPGSLAKVLQVIADAGLTIDHLQALRRDQGRTLWEITLEMDEEADRSLYGQIDALPSARFVGKSDRVFDRHRGGKIRTRVGHRDHDPADPPRRLYAGRRAGLPRDPQGSRAGFANTRASATRSQSSPTGRPCSGSATSARSPACPVMEGKAALFSTLVDINAVPILLDETDPARCIDHIAAIASGFGAILLEDFAAPACFEIEEGCARGSTRPVLHDDQHGTAVVVLAAAFNATKRAGIDVDGCVVGQIGLGAAGIGIVRLLHVGVRRLLGADLDQAALKRFRRHGRRAGVARRHHAKGRHRHRDDRGSRTRSSPDGAKGPDHHGAVESRTRRSSRRSRSSRAPRSPPTARASTTCWVFRALQGRARRARRRASPTRCSWRPPARSRNWRKGRTWCPMRSTSSCTRR